MLVTRLFCFNESEQRFSIVLLFCPTFYFYKYLPLKRFLMFGMSEVSNIQLPGNIQRKKTKKIIRKGIRAVSRQIFPRRTFRRRTVRRMTFLQTDISPNHVFLFRSKFKINLRKIQGKFNLIVYIFLAAKKVVDSIVHGLLLAKLSAYGFDYDLPEPINSFLSDRKFRRKIGSSYSPNH